MDVRIVTFDEKKKRGCNYCKDMQPIRDYSRFRTGCPHEECPYRVLDKYDTYEDFMASDDAKILVDGFFSTTASCYELANANATVKHIYGSDKHARFL